MGPKKTEEKQSVPPELLVPRARAEQMIEARMASGRQLASRTVSSNEEFEQARGDYYTWTEYNEEMLRRIFTNDSFAEGYRGLFLGGGGAQSLSQMIAEFRGDVEDRVRRLGSIAERLELVPEARGIGQQEPTGATMTPLDGVAVDRRSVFVVHGRNGEARDGLFAFLRSIGLAPLEWSQAVQATGKPSPYVGEVLNAAFSRARAVVVLMTPDDEARLREEFRQPADPPHEVSLTPQARANVLFEAGMAMGRFPDRTVLVELGSLRPFSDIGGRHVVRLDNSSQRRQELAQRLETAGCPVDLSGTEWHTAGELELGGRGGAPLDASFLM